VLLAGGKISKDGKIQPGNLKVSRSIGDIMSKNPQLKEQVILNEPDLHSFKTSDIHDYLVLVSDGITCKLSNKEIS